VALCDAQRTYLKSVVGAAGLGSGESRDVRLSVCPYVLAGEEPLVVADAQDVSALSRLPAVRDRLVAHLAGPIVVEGHAVGALGVAMHEPRAWTAHDRALLHGLAGGLNAEVALRLAAEDLRRSNAVVASHNRIHELIGARAPLREILTELVLSMERFDDRLRGSVLLVDPGLQTLHHGAAPSLPASYVAAIDGVAIRPDGGSCGAAAWHGAEVITEDTEADPRWEAFRPLARAHGLRHCWSFPILGADGVLGTFGIYGSEPRVPPPDHLRFLRDAAHLAGIAIERHRAVDDVVHRATHDPLTGLPNRALLFDRLAQALARGRRSGEAVAVLSIDLDRLKLINDTVGHEVGDDLVRRTGEALAGCVRPGDTVAHIGADEFVVVAEDIDDDVAVTIAERVVAAAAAVRAPAGDHTTTTTASVGVALVRGETPDARAVLRLADEAMQAAKEEGGNRFRVAGQETAGASGRRLEIEKALRGALQRGEFSLFAQPIARFGSDTVVGVEALLRWTHPELGPVGPAEFIPIAERAGMIEELGAWALREACCAVARLPRTTDRPLQLGVNVSPRQLRGPDFAGVVRRALQDGGLAPEQLVVEITETALLGTDPETLQTLNALRELGVRLELDDFGTGFSSLSMLKERPIDGIKIDQSFVRGLPGDPSSGAIVAAVVAMARALSRTVTAEGIETPEQLAFLQALGCDLAQGYLIGRPMPFAALADWLEEDDRQPA
jgi:diguanylate cyclase (GGDEF)-like protein